MDLDGTLLSSDGHVPEENVRAIAEAAARGIEIVIVTGRRFHFALPAISAIPSELHLIVNNGAMIKSRDGSTHARNLLPRHVARRVLQATALFRTGAAVVFDRPLDRQVIFERLDWNDPARRRYYERNRPFLAEVAPLENCLDDEDDPIQVMFTGTVTTMRDALRILHSMPPDGQFSLAVTEYEDKDFTILDVIQHGCSKGATLAAWAKLRGIAREEVMAIGDNWNDREMLEFAGFPVVMGNSAAQLKSLGWPVTLGNDQCGVAAAIRTCALAES
jgi:Cof subfamily protein (haloacid dehalogenase superfamily)